jgi:hypothetical protein
MIGAVLLYLVWIWIGRRSAVIYSRVRKFSRELELAVDVSTITLELIADIVGIFR